MCEWCEGEYLIPTGGGAEEGRDSEACPAQLAESLRDAIRAVADFSKLDLWGKEIDRVIDELVRRARLGDGVA